MKCIVIASGDGGDPQLIKNICDTGDFIICADGGAKHAKLSSVVPNIIIGDLDSIDEDDLKWFDRFNVPIKDFPTKKDYTDMELCLNFAVEKGATEITILGAIGSRLDHSIANIMLLYDLFQKGIDAKIINDHNKAFLFSGRGKVLKEDYKYISLIPIFGDVSGITLKGFEYKLNKATIKFSATLGISNELIEDEGEIDIEDGICLVVKSKD
ncbi:thiamine diphosphokinase [Clostridiisalibacter paucivorans]|uniref:thiamine diphosphokinase n=1 Tax=Clostridiisalibacter paucivorans TaxID=408753 RepID=UPI000478B915|nr:thiamine diphosphokinase [Clostridiisalibacter paucivorans]